MILASQSPRRRQLLEMLGFEFDVVPAGADEHIAPGTPPREAAVATALKKAEAVSGKVPPDALVVAADTAVYVDGELLGKPENAKAAADMLRRLSGRKHTVYTGLAVVCAGRVLTGCEATDVYFIPLSEDEIASYVATGEPMDKAGAYGAQGRAAVFIERVDGDFFNVVGLPLARLYGMLKELNFK